MNKDGDIWSGPNFYDFYVQGLSTDFIIFNDNELATLKDAYGKWGAVNKEGVTKIPFI